MDGKRRLRLVRVGLILAVAIGATVAANVALLGYANKPNDPVGRLSPLTTGVAAPPAAAVPGRSTTAATRTAPAATGAGTARPPATTTRTGADGHGGGSHGTGSGSGHDSSEDD